MENIPNRVIAVDWSGAKKGFKKKIWLAEVGADGLRTLKDGWSREKIGEYLSLEIERDPKLVIGLDFAFSFPAWFVRQKGCASASELWQHVEAHGEEWLVERQPPFFTKGGWADNVNSAYRLTETRLREQGSTPETVFKLVGPTQVGPGSIRGMPTLTRLSKAGFNVWPFDPPKLPLVVEIYPGSFYPKGVKSSLEKRLEFLKRYPDLEELQRANASCSDDAFDAAISAFKMFERRNEFAQLVTIADDSIKVEGQIWS